MEVKSLQVGESAGRFVGTHPESSSDLMRTLDPMALSVATSKKHSIPHHVFHFIYYSHESNNLREDLKDARFDTPVNVIRSMNLKVLGQLQLLCDRICLDRCCHWEWPVHTAIRLHQCCHPVAEVLDQCITDGRSW